ncbi:uncharacterized protein LOC115956939 [Quercus lobata]|uniref:uncharacterized protein LOC115956939 n=1 Tax=Quercus lobata TaxID=97700 RepID=UPI001247C644|nr:uncharacterized protein LOC115956939 [Quercus lobata]
MRSIVDLEPLLKCSCGAMKILSATHDKAYVMPFLMGLNENFETIRTQILMYEPFPSISKVYGLVLQEESHKNIGHGGSFATKPGSVAMYVNSKGNSSGNANWTKGNNKKERPLCTHCNMLGHTIDKCYKLHGYPPGYKPKGKSNANQVSYDQGAMIEHSSLGSVQCPITKAQCEQLLAFFNTSSNSGDKHQATTVNSGDGMPSLMTGVAGVASSFGVPPGTGLAATISHPSISNSYLETMAARTLLIGAQLVWVESTMVFTYWKKAYPFLLQLLQCFLSILFSHMFGISYWGTTPSSTNTDSFVTPVFIPNSLSDCSDSSVSPSAPNFVNHSIETSNTLLADAPTADCLPSRFPLVPSAAVQNQTCASTPEVPPAPIRKSARTSKPLAYLQDYSCASACSPASGGPYDIGHSLTYAHLIPSYQSYVLAVSSTPQELQSFFQAVKDPLWREAMDK